MKYVETLAREETRETVDPIFAIDSAEITQSIQTSEPDSENPFRDIIGREAYRLSPLSEW